MSGLWILVGPCQCKPPAPEPCQGCGRTPMQGCICPSNYLAIGRGERRKAKEEEGRGPTSTLSKV
jgi:hypothetical protein